MKINEIPIISATYGKRIALIVLNDYDMADSAFACTMYFMDGRYSVTYGDSTNKSTSKALNRHTDNLLSSFLSTWKKQY